MTASQLSRACQKMLDGCNTAIRVKAKEVYEMEYNLCKLHWLGMVSVRPDAEPRLTVFYRWLIAQDLGRYL